MKKLLPFAVAAALCAPLSFGQATSKPVGYETFELTNGFNVVGLRLHSPVDATGSLTGVSGNTVTDSEADFSGLDSETTYLFEIVDDASPLNGAVVQVSSNSTDSLTLEQDLAALGLTTGTSYQVRAAKTINDVFGEDNSFGLDGTDDFDINNADVIYLPNSSGGLNRYYFSTSQIDGFGGWFSSDSLPSGDVPIVYTSGILIQKRAGSPIDFVVTGSVKLSDTLVTLGENFTYISSVAPAGSTLSNSGLENFVDGTDDFDPNNADVVYIPTATGFNRYFFSTSTIDGFGGWFSTDSVPSGDVEFTGGVLVLNRGAAKGALLSVPSSYSSL